MKRGMKLLLLGALAFFLPHASFAQTDTLIRSRDGRLLLRQADGRLWLASASDTVYVRMQADSGAGLRNRPLQHVTRVVLPDTVSRADIADSLLMPGKWLSRIPERFRGDRADRARILRIEGRERGILIRMIRYFVYSPDAQPVEMMPCTTYLPVRISVYLTAGEEIAAPEIHCSGEVPEEYADILRQALRDFRKNTGMSVAMTARKDGSIDASTAYALSCDAAAEGIDTLFERTTTGRVHFARMNFGLKTLEQEALRYWFSEAAASSTPPDETQQIREYCYARIYGFVQAVFTSGITDRKTETFATVRKYIQDRARLLDRLRAHGMATDAQLEMLEEEMLHQLGQCSRGLFEKGVTPQMLRWVVRQTTPAAERQLADFRKPHKTHGPGIWTTLCQQDFGKPARNVLTEVFRTELQAGRFGVQYAFVDALIETGGRPSAPSASRDSLVEALISLYEDIAAAENPEAATFAELQLERLYKCQLNKT